jgi:5-oxoprolinase (ATP-hydrolysing) subunit A
MIDLNSDLGESFGVYRLGEDEEILRLVSSANIACGFHAGDPQVMARTVRAAVELGVAIGAHPSYPDRVGFGRRHMDISPDDLTWDLVYQIAALDGMAKAAGGRVSYVKPHGALYNRIAVDETQAAAVVKAIAAYNSELILLTLPDSAAMAAATANGLSTVSECFADRAYTADGRLVPRGQAGAVIDDEAAVVSRAVELATKGTITSIDGTIVTVRAQSICLHGDTPGAARLARAIRDGLEAADVAVTSFSG